MHPDPPGDPTPGPCRVLSEQQYALRYYVRDGATLMLTLLLQAEYETMEVCPKIMFQMEMVKSDRDHDFGIAVEAELAEDAEQEDELCVFISEVVKGGLGHRRGENHCTALHVYKFTL